MAQLDWPLGMPLAIYIEGGIWEVRHSLIIG